MAFKIDALWSKTLDLLYPPLCQICGVGHAGKTDCYICQTCRAPQNIRWIRDSFCQKCGCPFDGDFSIPFECHNCLAEDFAFEYARSGVQGTAVMREVIHGYKYAKRMWFEPFLADILIEAASPYLSEWSMVVPVPLHPTREREREFNQAKRLAARFCEASGLELNEKALRRVKMTSTQTAFNREERAANVENAFEVGNGQVQGHCVILIDDVLTTGATTNECAKELKKAGASRVCVWTVVRSL